MTSDTRLRGTWPGSRSGQWKPVAAKPLDSPGKVARARAETEEARHEASQLRSVTDEAAGKAVAMSRLSQEVALKQSQADAASLMNQNKALWQKLEAAKPLAGEVRERERARKRERERLTREVETPPPSNDATS